MMAKVRAPGSCGELVQGTIDGSNFLITCPVDIFTEVAVEPEGRKIAAGPKTFEAVRRTMAYLGAPGDKLSVTVSSSLPQGKGMASSSADISAACQAAALSLGKTLTPDEIADLALGIEPTDGIFYPGIVLFDHVRGTVRKPLGEVPPMSIVIFDSGGQVDTQEFNSRRDLAGLNRAKEPQIRQAVELVARGLAEGDCLLIGQGATLSAMANQRILFKACLPDVIDTALEFGAVGVNVAHSGTVIGCLFTGAPAGRMEECVAAVRLACPGIEYLRTARLISGGLTVLEAPR